MSSHSGSSGSDGSAGSGFKRLNTLSGLGTLDQILGFVVGSSKFFFILSIIVYALFSVTAIRENFEEKMAQSFFYEPMMATGNFILHIETDDLKAILDGNASDANTTDANATVDANQTSEER